MPRPKRFEGMSDEQLRQVYEQEKQSRGLAQAPQAQPQDNMASILSYFNKPRQGSGVREAIGDALMVFGGGKPPERKQPSALDQLLETAKATEAAKTMGNRGLYDTLRGGQPSMDTAQPNGQPAQYPGMQAPEVDTFSGELTSRGLQQKMQNQLIEQEATQNLKSKVPTAKQKQDLDAVTSGEAFINQLEKDASSLPSGYGGIGANVKNFFKRGESNPDLEVYNDNRPALAVNLYRMLTGDTRLSDADAAARALPLLWSTDEGPTVRTRKFANIKALINARKSAIQSGKYTQTPEGDFITPLETLDGGEMGGMQPTGGGGDELSQIEAELAQINSQLGQQ